MLKLSYNSNGLRTVGVTRAIEAVAEAGYQAIELSLHPAHIDPFSFTPADAREIERAVERTGITLCCLATGADTLLSDERFEPSLIHPTQQGRDRRVDLIRRSLEIARVLDVPVINFASGIRQPAVPADAAHSWLTDGLKRLIEYAGNDVVLALEPEPGFHVQTNDQAGELIAELGSAQLTLAQDLGHCRVVEEDYLASVGRSLPVTSIIQVEDIKGRHHHHEVPGDGDIDFAAFFATCVQGGYRGYYSVELYNHGDDFRAALARSHRHLSERYRAAVGG